MPEQLKWALKMFDNHPDPMVVSRIRDGRIERVNAAFLSLFGYDQTEVIGKSSLDLSMIEKADRQESINLLKKQGFVRDKNVNIRTKHGEIRSANLTVVEAEDDDEPRILTIIHDVTDLKQIKEYLAHDQEIIQHLIDNIPVLLTIWDPKLQRFTLNRHAESVLGWTTADANEGDIMSKVFPGPVYCSNIATFMQSLSPEWREQNMIAKDGSIIPTTWTNTRLSDDTMIGIGLDLRERNRALHALRESEGNFRIALKHSNFVPAQFDRNQRYRWIYNPHPDFNPAVVIGKRDDELEDSQGANQLVALKQQVIETGIVVHEEIAFDRSDGTCIYDFMIEPLRDACGEITGGTSAAYDITRQKLAELSLRESEERFRTMADGLPLIIWVTDTENRQLFVNQQFEGFFGITEKQIKKGHWQLLLHPDDAAYAAEFEACVRHRQPFHAIARVWQAAGEWRWIESWGRPRFIPSGEFVGYVGTSTDITDRKKAERALQESEYKYRLLAEEAPISIMHFDKNGMVTFVNKWHINVFAKGELDRDFFLNKKITDLPGIQSAGIGSELKKILNGEKVILDQVHIPKFAVGQEGYQAIKGVPLFHGAEVIGGVLIREDITDRKQAEEALRESEEKHRRLFETMVQGVTYQDADGEIISANPAAERILGLSFDQMRGKTFMDPPWRMIKEDGTQIPGTDHPIMIALRTGETVGPVVRGVFHPEKNTHVWLSITAIPLLQPGETKPFQAYATLEDITERKQAEEALRDSEARSGIILNAVPDLLFVLDRQGTHLDYYAYDESLLAIQPSIFLGKSIFDVLPEDVAKSYWQSIKRAIETRQIELLEYTLPVADESRIFEARISLMSEDRVISIVRDITERRRTEEALLQLTETLEKQVAERTRIAESRSKLLQSLAVELVQAEEFERQRIADLLHDDLQQLIASARMQVQSAFFMSDPGSILKNVDQLLGDSLEKSRRLSHELSPPVLRQFGLAAALEWLVRHMDEKFELKVRLESKLMSEIRDAAVNVFLFRAAQELLFNVVKHSGVDSAEVALYDWGNVVTLSVSDQGKGFDPGIMDSYARKAGIGLVSLRERATAIGGNLDITSAPGKGSRFTLTAPIRLVIAEEHDKLAQDTVSQSGILEKQAVLSDSEIIRVLLVDDHKVMRQGLISMISDKPGIEVAGEAESGEEALELARQLKPDVIIMDISMPGMSGVEATRLIKAENPEIRVIGLSMFAEEDISQKMREAGADGFVSKTESSSELLKAIYEVAG